MKNTRPVRAACAAATLALALSVTACGERNQANDDRDTVGTSGAAGEKTSVTLSGCLQRSDGNDFVLTQANASSGDTAPSKAASDRGSVEQRQRAQASRSYRLSGDSDQLRDLVGHQVRVSGTLDDRGDLKEDGGRTNDRGAVGTTGDRDRREIKEGDLARVDVSSVESIAKSCGTSNQR
jgi:hypothetical protein